MKLNSKEYYTKTEQNDTKSEIHKTDFDEISSHENKFLVKGSIEEEEKNMEKINSEDNYIKIDQNDIESEIHKTDLNNKTSLVLD